MKPMLARTYGPKFSRFPCFLQPKLNGVRALYQRVSGAGVMQSRDEKLWTPTIISHILDELDSIRHIVGDRILDGELYVHGWRLQDINSAIAVKRGVPSPKSKDVEYHVFDIVDPATKFYDRWSEFAEALFQADLRYVRVVPTDYVETPLRFNDLFRHYVSLGYEGVMLRTDEPYEFGQTPHGTEKRSTTLWKHKSWEDGEFMCVGYTPGEGKASIGIGALTLSAFQPAKGDDDATNKKFNVGTGFTDADRIEFFHNPPIGKLVRVRYLELTADGIPFNPSFLGVM